MASVKKKSDFNIRGLKNIITSVEKTSKVGWLVGILQHINSYRLFKAKSYIYNRLIGLVGRVLANGPEDLGFNPRSSHTKDWYLNGTWYLLA